MVGWAYGTRVLRIVCCFRLLILSAQIWDLFEGGRLFRAVRDGHLNDEQHLAEMISLLGPPPKRFLERSNECSQYWDADGEHNQDKNYREHR